MPNGFGIDFDSILLSVNLAKFAHTVYKSRLKMIPPSTWHIGVNSSPISTCIFSLCMHVPDSCRMRLGWQGIHEPLQIIVDASLDVTQYGEPALANLQSVKLLIDYIGVYELDCTGAMKTDDATVKVGSIPIIANGACTSLAPYGGQCAENNEWKLGQSCVNPAPGGALVAAVSLAHLLQLLSLARVICSCPPAAAEHVPAPPTLLRTRCHVMQVKFPIICTRVHALQI